MRNLLIIVSMLLTLVGCTSKEKGTSQSKSLVVYYSQTGATARVAQEFARQLNADTLRIEAIDPYSGSFEESIARCQKEMADSLLPQLSPITVDLAAYDTIYIGYPIWFGTYAPPIASLVSSNTFEGKTIVPFCTFGSGGLTNSTNNLKAALPKANVIKGYGVRNARIESAPEEITDFLVSIGSIAGTIKQLPEFSDQKPVGETEKAAFDAACGSYPMPLGTPETVGSRETDKGTEYKFTVNRPAPNGTTSKATIYVRVPTDTVAKPEFLLAD